jgi:hypothetical protein
MCVAGSACFGFFFSGTQAPAEAARVRTSALPSGVAVPTCRQTHACHLLPPQLILYCCKFPIHLELLEPAAAVALIPALVLFHHSLSCLMLLCRRFPIHLELLEPAAAVALIPRPEEYEVPANVGWCSDQGWDITKVRRAVADIMMLMIMFGHDQQL